ncbi:MAG: peptidylprolyl isomerase [Candidatus Colwellbacteria bacterium CG10_big_fil_rev_8_21_14_0_10_41_28]|uniref:Peptidyl-prolyl cis-trans isomerase n=1 Tax=Candidatus Colwellbacteria bacterium CG10_big_fil_rev_8_21_14_0_10_41_28 TaxID=1974539 RepID=A0A2H0VH22_9BACT|nr:MAG: peptidylprolyl isomerase [Candidatus Colwellbacteria bacterium CG10_big_fil_rev_8_21_14_0_10_41_28]
MGDVVLKTSMGDVVIDLFEDEAPITSGNFLKLAKEGFYNGTRFHRVIEDFMIQGGDPLSKDPNQKSLWGTGGPGYQFEDEVVPGLSNVSGTISMANAGPGTNGSQFFLNVADNSFLDGRHTVFGKVVNGMDVVMAMSGVETEGKGTMDRPREDLILEEINVIEE